MARPLAGLDSLGYIALRDGHYARAVDHHRRAVALCRGLGHAYAEADTLDGLAEAHTARGQHDLANQASQPTLELYQAQNRSADARVAVV